MPCDRRADIGQQLLVVPRLLNEVLRARAHRFDDVFDRTVGGDHHHWQFGVALVDLRQQFKAALAGQREIEQHQVIAALLQQREPLLAIDGHFHVIALKRQQDLERLANPCFIIDYQDLGVCDSFGCR